MEVNGMPQESAQLETPQDTATQPQQQQPQQTSIDDLDKGIKKDEVKLSLMQEEYTSIVDKISDEFDQLLEANPSALFSQEEIEALSSDSNIASKRKMLRDRYEKYRDEKLSLKSQEIEKFKNELDGRKQGFDILAESNKFSQENPDMDMEALAEFIQEDLSPRVAKQFKEQAKNKYEFLTLAAAEFKKQNSQQKDDDDQLPPDLDQINGATGDGGYSTKSEQEKYLKAIGVGR